MSFKGAGGKQKLLTSGYGKPCPNPPTSMYLADLEYVKDLTVINISSSSVEVQLNQPGGHPLSCLNLPVKCDLVVAVAVELFCFLSQQISSQ